MKKVKLLEQFLQEDLNEGLFDVVTKSKAFIRNPISATKITNNGKKLAQAEIDNAANELDYEKRKLAAKKAMDSKIEAANQKGDKEAVQKIKDQAADSREVLKKAQDQKAEALKDKVESIKDRIDDLATNNTLKGLGSMVKTAARVKRNEVLLKGADDEEKKQLKIQMKDDMEKIDDLKKGFGEYEGAKDEEDKKPEQISKPKEEPKETKKDGAPPKDKDAEPKEKSKKSTEVDKPLTTSSDLKKSEPKDPMDKLSAARQELRDAQRTMANNQKAVKNLQDRIDNINDGKYDKKKIEDPKAEIERLQSEKKRAEQALADSREDVKMMSSEADKAEKEYNAKETKKAAEEGFSGLKSYKDFISG